MASDPITAHLLAQPGIQKVPSPKLTLFIQRGFLDAATCAALCAKIEAERMVEEAKRDAARTRRELVQRAGEDVQRLRLRARREIELAKRKAIHDLADRGAEVAVRVAEQTLLTRMTPADDDRLVQAALDEMARAAGGLQ